MRPTHPRALERDYERALSALLKPALKIAAGIERRGAFLSLLQSPNTIEAEIVAIGDLITSSLDIEQAERVVARHLERVRRRHGLEWRQVAKTFRLNPLAGEDATRVALARAFSDNLALIRSVPLQASEQIRERAFDAWAEGRPELEIAELVKERLGVSTSRARLIARDQVQKLNGELTRERHLSAGVTSYRWLTARDERVRATHAARHGQVFDWSEPPDDGHPGHAIGCRCVAVPVVT